MRSMFLRAKNDSSGVILVTVLMLTAVMAIVAITIISMNVSQVTSSQNVQDQLVAEQLAIGRYYQYLTNQLVDVPAGTPGGTPTDVTINSKTFSTTVTNPGGAGPNDTVPVTVDVGF